MGFDRLAPPYIKAMNILVRTDPDTEQRVVAEGFSPPTTRKRAKRNHVHSHEDSEEQIAGSLAFIFLYTPFQPLIRYPFSR